MMARAAIVRSPTTDRLHSLIHKKKNVRLSGKPINFTHSSWKPMNNSQTLWESRKSSHTPWELGTSGKPRSYTQTSWESTNNPHALWEPRNSTHPPCESHSSGNRKNYTHRSWEPTNNPQESRNFSHPPWKSHTSGKPRSYTFTSREPSNFASTSGKPSNFTSTSGKPSNFASTSGKPSNFASTSGKPSNFASTSGKPSNFTSTSGKPSNFTSTSGKPENSTGISGKPRSVSDLNPLTTPTQETDQQKDDSASIQQIRHPSERRDSLGNDEMSRKEGIHQEKSAGQSLKLKIRLNGMFEKKNYHICIEESTRKAATAKAKGLGKRKLSLGKRSCLKCYTCGKLVKGVHVEYHLFFGEMECTSCNWKISSCDAFRENKMDQISGNSTCLHDLRYCVTPSEYISNKMSQESPLELDRSKLHSYVCSLKRLKVSEPWKKAIDQCVKFLKRETSQPSEKNEHLNVVETVYSLPEESVPTSKHEVRDSPLLAHENNDLILSQSYDLEHLDNIVEYEIARDYPEVRIERSPALFTESSGECNHLSQTNIDTCSGSLARDISSQSTSLSDMAGIVGSINSTRSQKGAKKKKQKPAKRSKSKPGLSREQVVETPSNRYYLIVRHAIEECPMCYTEFCPSRFTVNVYSFLLTTVCIGCDLTVYILIDPAQKIIIETESDPPKKKKNIL